MEIVAATGEIHAGDTQVIEEAARRAALQDALGDNYEVRRLLGRGGFAEVYVAWDKRLKREIAVKTIRGDLVVNDNLLERFQREAEAVAKLRHPNIVPIYAVGEANGVAYFTMPLIEGQSLADVIEREGRVPVEESIRILREASGALHGAHRIGLVHRDIKPENIMLEGPERSAIVMDFGIAKAEGAEGKGLTGTGMLVGTPQYMSPEQAVGERSLDARSDQYSLAMVGYRMLTGRLPFESDSIQTLIFKTVTSVPPLAIEVAPDVPREISEVLAKALAKRSEDRYETMAAFSTALGQAQGGGARSGATSGSFRSAMPALAARVKAARAALPSLRNPLVGLAVIAAVAGLFLEAKVKSRVGVTLAANRAEAVFAAKNFLRDRGVIVDPDVDPTFDTRAPVLGFLTKTISADSMDRRAATDALIWRWSMAFGKSNDSSWTVDVGPDNRIVGFRHKLVDSSQAPSISHDSARGLAEREVASRGWPMTTLKPVLDSTITRKHRVDHLFRWRKKAGAIAWRGADSAYVEIRAGVSGASVTDYSSTLHTPDSYQTATASKTPLQIITTIGITLTVVIGLMAFVLAVSRQRVDELQWTSTARILAVAALCIAPAAWPSVAAGFVGSSSAVVTLLISVITVGFLAACVLVVAVVAESLASETNPAVVQGLGELSRGRSLPPEAITGTIWGYVIAGIGLGATGLVQYLSNGVLGDPSSLGSVNSVFGFTWPAAYGVVMFGVAIAAAYVLVYVIALFAQWRLTSRIAVFMPVILVVAMTAAKGHPDTTLNAAVSVALMAWAAWRFGFLAGVMTIWLPDMIDSAWILLRAPGGETMTAGVISLLIAFIPLVVVLMARRRVLEVPAVTP
jgi:serine/threonine-protein kinase